MAMRIKKRAMGFFFVFMLSPYQKQSNTAINYTSVMSGSNLGRVGESYVSSSGRPDEMLGTYAPFPAGKDLSEASLCRAGLPSHCLACRQGFHITLVHTKGKRSCFNIIGNSGRKQGSRDEPRQNVPLITAALSREGTFRCCKLRGAKVAILIFRGS